MKAFLRPSAFRIGLIVLVAVSRSVAGDDGVTVNFAHLDHLTEPVVFGGKAAAIVHIYANYPDYKWVDAKESGPEGIACVDDAARAAVVYLRDFELNGRRESLGKARLLLRFVSAMETDDGMFYNFILADHSINTGGRTSYKSFGWWASRGVWCMSYGARIFRPIDRGFSDSLLNGVARTFTHIDTLLERFGRVHEKEGYRIPEWLPYESGADVTSELLLGLIEYFRLTHDASVRRRIEKLSAGLMLMQDGDVATYPFGVHRSWETMWHMWGNGQTEALATAGALLGDSAMVRSAQREADGFYSRLLVDGFRKEWDIAKPGSTVDYEQIAYGVRPMAVGLLRLAEATHDSTYAKLAGLSASWLTGNNILGMAMYDPATGRTYDGIRDAKTVNLNSGAESTIEGLFTLLEVDANPVAARYLQYRRTGTGSNKQYRYALFEGKDGHLVLAIDLQLRALRIFEGTDAVMFINALKK